MSSAGKAKRIAQRHILARVAAQIAARKTGAITSTEQQKHRDDARHANEWAAVLAQNRVHT